MSDRDIAERLADLIIADALDRGWITNGHFAERLIYERRDARDEILRLRMQDRIRAVNAHEELLEALKYYLSGCSNEECEYCIRARAAIAKAGGREGGGG